MEGGLLVLARRIELASNLQGLLATSTVGEWPGVMKGRDAKGGLEVMRQARGESKRKTCRTESQFICPVKVGEGEHEWDVELEAMCNGPIAGL